LKNRNTETLEVQNRAVLKQGIPLELLSIILKPSHFGFIDTSIILIFKQEDGIEHRVELPIIGSVVRQNHVFGDTTKSPAKFEPWRIATPAIIFNVNRHLPAVGETIKGG
jgi:hypothetical protein